MKQLRIQSLGPIATADISFGDLTLFVGPQASGKSIVLQLIKLIEDKKHIRKTLEQYGYIWGRDATQILDRYFGEGMSSIWKPTTQISYDGKAFEKETLLPKQRESIRGSEEKLFFIPAQRVVCFENGWPRFFTSYEDSVPFVLRQFSETLRQLLENGIEKAAGADQTIFPQSQRLKAPLRNSFTDSIFHQGKIVLDNTSGKKRISMKMGNTTIPFMAWSAGQKEFMPMLLSFYWLCPPSKVTQKDAVKYVVVEEPEMGLHPQAIQSVLLQIMDLLNRDYKVIVSTHSPVFTEFAWAIAHLKKFGAAPKVLFDLFGVKKFPGLLPLFENILESQKIKTYYFSYEGNTVQVRDISSLDAGSEDKNVAEWGGLSSFSARAVDLIAESAQNG